MVSLTSNYFKELKYILWTLEKIGFFIQQTCETTSSGRWRNLVSLPRKRLKLHPLDVGENWFLYPANVWNYILWTLKKFGFFTQETSETTSSGRWRNLVSLPSKRVKVHPLDVGETWFLYPANVWNSILWTLEKLGFFTQQTSENTSSGRWRNLVSLPSKRLKLHPLDVGEPWLLYPANILNYILWTVGKRGIFNKQLF